MGKWLKEKEGYNQPLIAPAPNVTVPSVAENPDKYIPPAENVTAVADNKEVDFVNRGGRNLIDLIKEYGQPYDYEKEMAQAERSRKAALLADTFAVAGNALAGAFGANQLGQLPNHYKDASSKLDRIREARTKQLIDNRRLLMDAAMKQHEYDRQDERYDKESAWREKQFADSLEHKANELTYRKNKDIDEQKNRDREYELKAEQAKRDEEYKRGNLSLHQYQAKTQRISAERDRPRANSPASKAVTIEYQAAPDDKDAEVSVTGKRVKKITLSPESAKNIVREALRDEAFLKARPDVIIQKPDRIGGGSWKFKDDDDVAAAYMEYTEGRKNAQGPPFYMYPFTMGKPVAPEPDAGKTTGETAKTPNLSSEQISGMKKIADKYPDDDNAAIVGVTDYLRRQGLGEEDIKTILKKTWYAI
jgi:hypothetical protein